MQTVFIPSYIHDRKKRLDFDIDESTTDGIISSDRSFTQAYFEIKVAFGGQYDQVAIGLTST